VELGPRRDDNVIVALELIRLGFLLDAADELESRGSVNVKSRPLESMNMVGMLS
jgi:hypothetical protein